MVGYLDQNCQILNEWFRLFQKNKNSFSNQKIKNWENVKKDLLLNLNQKEKKYDLLKKLSKYTFIYTPKIKLKKIECENFSLIKNSHRLVFINGKFSSELSDKNIDPWKIKIFKNEDLFSSYQNPIKPELFLHLIECLSHELTHIILPSGKTSFKPLYLLHISDGLEKNNVLTITNYRHHIEIKNNANASIIEHFVSMKKNGKKHFSGARTSIVLDDHANLNHIKLEFENKNSYHISHNDIHIGYSSHLSNTIFNIYSSKFIFQQTSSKVNFSNSSLFLNSLSLPVKEDINDIRIYLEHNNINYACSHQLHKIIACNHAYGKFTGLIKINKNSMKTNGKMISKNLLLSKFSKINSLPKLKIYSDNVKCSHAATIGHLDMNQMFYLRSRGISNQEALCMLIHAFAAEVANIIKNNLISEIILKKINHTFNKYIINDISN